MSRPTSLSWFLVASITIALLAFPIYTQAQSPQISNVTPTSGVAGKQVTIVGTGFGATQGSGNVWLGSTYGVVGTWSDTLVVATIASGAKSGTAQILQGRVWSNSINLTVVTPNITSVTPTSGVAGTQVTIAGTAFGATQGSGNVWLGFPRLLRSLRWTGRETAVYVSGIAASKAPCPGTDPPHQQARCVEKRRRHNCLVHELELVSPHAGVNPVVRQIETADTLIGFEQLIETGVVPAKSREERVV
ncbi:MAG: IPT/TIG domain-containing protein [Terriglobales bacterium]